MLADRNEVTLIGFNLHASSIHRDKIPYIFFLPLRLLMQWEF